MERLLSLLEQNPRLTNAQLAVMLGQPEQEVAAAILQYEQEGVILGYTALIDRERLEQEYVEAQIELCVTPKKEEGFEHIAKQVASYPEVKSVSLMSGGYDLSVIVSGNNFKEIALFVSNHLSTLDSVLSTKTHFLLKRYKENGTLVGFFEPDERGAATYAGL